MRTRWATLACVGLLAGSTVVLAQAEDDQTRDHRRRDEQYYEQLKRRLEQKEALGIREGEEEVDAMARVFFERADELIRDKNYRSATADGYRIQTDDPRLDPDAVAELLGRFRVFFDEFWRDRLELMPYEGDSRTFLFYSFAEFNDLLGGHWRRQWIRPKGHYGSFYDALVLHTDSEPLTSLADTLVHEAAHQLVDKRIYGERFPSIWVSEGLASYFGYTYMDSEGRFQPGVVGGKVAALAHRAKPKADRRAGARLRGFRKSLKSDEDDPSGEGGRVRQVVEALSPGSFYEGAGVLDRYTVSWLLVHSLLHGDDGAHAAAFARYLQLEADGKGGPDVLYETIGLGPDELEAAMERHVPSIRIR